MTQQEYEQKRYDAKKLYLSKFVAKEHLDTYEHELFDFAFARGYALCKQEPGASGIKKARRKSDGEIIEVKEWRGASDVVYSSPDMNHFYQASDLDFNVDADSVISGWVARDEDGSFYFYDHKPIRDNEDKDFVEQNGDAWLLHEGLDIPDITWESEPQEVELIIRRKHP